MQITIQYKEQGELKPFYTIETFNTPYPTNEGEQDNWWCGFIYIPKSNERMFLLDNLPNHQLQKKWFVKQNLNWDDYFKLLAKEVKYIYIDNECYFSDEKIENPSEEV